MRITNPVFSLLLLHLSGCDLSDKGFRFFGRYEATRSGYRIHVVSKGYVRPGDDIARSAFAVVAFCPTRNSDGRPIRVTLTAIPDQWIKLNCEELGIVSSEMNWKSSENLLTTILSKAGYGNPVLEEVKGSATVIMNSLTGPKGVIMEGQGKSLQALQADITHGYQVDKTAPPKAWISLSEFPACDLVPHQLLFPMNKEAQCSLQHNNLKL